MPVLDGWPSPRPPRGDRATEPGVQPDSSAALCGFAFVGASGLGRRPFPADGADGSWCLARWHGQVRSGTDGRVMSEASRCSGRRRGEHGPVPADRRLTPAAADRRTSGTAAERNADPRSPLPGRCGPGTGVEFGRENQGSGPDRCGVSNSVIRWRVQQRARPGYPAMHDHMVGVRAGSMPGPYALRHRPHLSNIRAYACRPRGCFRPSRPGAVDSASGLMKTDQVQDRRPRLRSPGRHRKRQVNVFQ